MNSYAVPLRVGLYSVRPGTALQRLGRTPPNPQAVSSLRVTIPNVRAVNTALKKIKYRFRFESNWYGRASAKFFIYSAPANSRPIIARGKRGKPLVSLKKKVFQQAGTFLFYCPQPLCNLVRPAGVGLCPPPSAEGNSWKNYPQHRGAVQPTGGRG